MAVPKKRTSGSKRKIRNRAWRNRPAKVALTAFSLAQSVLTGRSKSFYYISEKKRSFQRLRISFLPSYLRDVCVIISKYKVKSWLDKEV